MPKCFEYRNKMSRVYIYQSPLPLVGCDIGFILIADLNSFSISKTVCLIKTKIDSLS